MDNRVVAKPLAPQATDGPCVTRAKEVWNSWLESGLQRLIDEGLVGLNVPVERIRDVLADEFHTELVQKIRRN